MTIEMKSAQREDLGKKYLEMEDPILDLMHMASIADKLAIETIGENYEMAADGEMVFKMTKAAYGLLRFAISKVSDMAEAVASNY